MPTVHFTSQLERFLPVPSVDVGPGTATLGTALAAVFTDHPALKSYILDDQGALRRHVAVFVAGTPARDRVKLTDPVGPDDEIHVFQALSGG
jgi:hypothetical protein